MSMRVWSQKQRLTALSVVVSLLLLFPISPSHGGGTIGVQTPVALNASSALAWSSAQTSLDFTSIYATVNPGRVYSSLDSGTTWLPIVTLGYKSWTGVAVNDTATVIGVVAKGDYLYLSSDSGATWSANLALGTGSWTDIDMNASGTVIVVTAASTVKVSTDSGVSWQTYSPGGTNNRSVTLSATGARMAVESYSGASTALYLSSDYGATWTPQTTPGGSDYNNRKVWMSRDGNKVIFSRYNSYILNYSSNFGTTWSTLSTPSNSRPYGAFAATDDLSKIWVADPNGSGKYSLNSGSTWTSYSTSYIFKSIYVNSLGNYWIGFSNGNNTGIWISNSNPGALTVRIPYDGYSHWSRVALSNDGQTIVAAGAYGEISSSSDGGATWTYSASLGIAGDWTCLAVSGDGNVIYAGYNGSPLYRSLDKGVTWSTLSGGALTSGNKIIYGCATNYDGTRIGVSIYSAGFLISTDSGATFSVLRAELINSVTYVYGAVVFSDDGAKIALASLSGGAQPIFLSTDAGVSWTASSLPASSWVDLKATADGSTLIAIPSYTNAPSISSNWGGSWQTMTGIGTAFKYGITINSDASVILAGQTITNGSIYYSTNKGATFAKFTGLSEGIYSSIAITGDASKIFIALNHQRLAMASLNVSSKVSFSSISIPSNAAIYRSAIVITANISTAGGDGKVTFFANGKKIPGCIKKSSISLVATCSWKPSTRGSVIITAQVIPTDTSLVTSTSAPVNFLVGNRLNPR
jgi:hypothetical protein